MAKSTHVTLTANTVSTVVVDNDYHGVEVVNVDGAAAVYFTVSSNGIAPSNPTIAGDDTIVLPAAINGVELAGDVVYGFAEIQVDAAGWDCRGLQLDVVKSGVSTTGSANFIASADRTQLLTALGPAPTGGLLLVTPRTQLDASLTAVRAVLRFYGSGTVRVGRMGVMKV